MAIPAVGASSPSLASGNSSANSSSAVQNFLDYMKETPAQRLEDSWLRAHGMTRQSLAAMSPAQQKAVMQQMQQDIELELKQAAEKVAGKTAITG